MAVVERDEVSGVLTTGHEWNGIKELDTNPPPFMQRAYWLAFLVAVGYWIFLPAWPYFSDYTRGLLGYQQRKVVDSDLKAAASERWGWVSQIEAKSLDEIAADEKLREVAIEGGKAAFGDNCAVCHGTDASGGHGFPNLTDGSWLWGGQLSYIHETLRVGVNTAHDESRSSQMMAFGRDQILDWSDIKLVAEYVLSLSDAEHEGDAGEQGAVIFEENCAQCHGLDGRGGRDFGAPNLTDSFWIYGGDRETVRQTIHGGRQGVMPYWSERLEKVTLKQLAVYVHGLGGGEPTRDEDE